LAHLEYDISKCWRRLKTPLKSHTVHTVVLAIISYQTELHERYATWADGVILVRIHLITGIIKHWWNCCFNNYSLFFIDHDKFYL